MHIGIVGLGLIGGSLGLEFVAAGHQVWGVSRSLDTCQQAMQQRAVHAASPALESLFEAELEVIFLCTPIPMVLPTLRALTAGLDPRTVLTDVASIKSPIVTAASQLWPNFLGGHPMAGTAEQGIRAAHLGLFRGRPYVLTPQPDTPALALERLQVLVEALGSLRIDCLADQHDQAVAWISHLPVWVSASLIAACLQGADPEVLPLAMRLASSGFRDTSRVGGGNPELGVAMAQFNRAALTTALTSYRQQIDQILAWLEGADWPALEDMLRATQQHRPEFISDPSPIPKTDPPDPKPNP